MPDLRQLLRKPVVYTVPGMEHVHVRKNVVYKTVAGDQLRLDVYYPPDLRPGVAFPAVIFIYGDGPPDILKEVKDAGQYVCWGQLIAASGLIGVTFQHRSSKSYTCLHEVAGDIDDLITYVRTQEEELQIDADRLGIWTCSGGPPAGLRTVLRDTPDFVRCIVSYYGVMSLQHVRGDFSLSLPDDTLREFSPVYHLGKRPKDIAPLFIVRAGFDRAWLNASIDQFVMDALTGNAMIDVMTHPDGHHAFDVQDDDARSREIIARTLEFIRVRLSGP